MSGDSSNYKSYAILFVDDEEKALKYFDRAFGSEFWVLTASSVAKAELVLEEHGDAIGVLITDQRMPEANGAELLEYTRENYPNIVRMLTTAYSDLEAAVAAINNGEIFRYTTKPWNIKSLRGELLRAMDYFFIRHERDLLLREKLSVWQRLVTIDKVRDILIMSASLSTLRHTLQAIYAYLMALPLSEKPQEESLKEFLDPWQFMQSDIQNSIELAQKVTAISSIDKSAQFGDTINLEVLLNELINRQQNEGRSRLTLQMEAAQEGVNVKGDRALLVQLFDTLLRYTFGDRVASVVRLEQAEHGARFTIIYDQQVESSPAEGSDISCSVDSQLLMVFLIGYHHGGEIALERSDPAAIKIVFDLPAVPETTDLPPPSKAWLEMIFSQYENI